MHPNSVKMKPFKLLVLFCFAIWFSSGNLFAQDEKLFTYQEVDTKPTFKGGDLNSFTVWVHKNVTYPSIARDNGVQGRIIIQFTVGPDGVVRDIKAIRSVDVTLEKEAIRVVKSSSKWEPGVKDGASVATRMNIPVIFRLL